MTRNSFNPIQREILRYANCWEDADILLQSCDARPGSRILSIGSAGDNSFSLLCSDPEYILVADSNPVQLYLIELKMQAIRQFDRNDVLSFLGFQPDANRKAKYQQLHPALSKSAGDYWSRQIRFIEQGVIHKGKFENYFQIFSQKILPFIHRKETVETLLSIKSPSEQNQFYRVSWNTLRWRLLFKLFFSRLIMGRLARDPQFFKEVNTPVSHILSLRAANHLSSVSAQNNFMLRYQLTGNFGSLHPHYLRPENFDQVQSRLNRMIIHQGFIQDLKASSNQFHFLNLSNIFEYMNPMEFQNASENLLKLTHSGGKMAYWNLLVPRQISQLLPHQVLHHYETSNRLSKLDKGFFYSRFIIDQKI